MNEIEVYTPKLLMKLYNTNPQQPNPTWLLQQHHSNGQYPYSVNIAATWTEWIDLAEQILRKDSLNKSLHKVDTILDNLK